MIHLPGWIVRFSNLFTNIMISNSLKTDLKWQNKVEEFLSQTVIYLNPAAWFCVSVLIMHNFKTDFGTIQYNN